MASSYRPRARDAERAHGLDVSVVERTAAGTTMTFTLSPEGFLLSETLVDKDGEETLGIPPGTIVGSSTYEPIRITDGW